MDEFNQSKILFASASQTATQTSSDIQNLGHRGIKVILDVTDVSGNGNITLTINFKDPASGKYINLLTGAAVSTTGTHVYTIFPGATAAANVSVNDCAPDTLQVVVTLNSGTSIVYSVGYSLLK